MKEMRIWSTEEAQKVLKEMLTGSIEETREMRTGSTEETREICTESVEDAHKQ